MLTKNHKYKDEGFTIIEVLIVLAIAALILVIVFLAVPTLQRNSRNTQRKNDAANALSALSNFVSNNNGSFPASCAGQGTGAGQCSFLTDVKFGYYQPNAKTGAITNAQFCATFVAPCNAAPGTEEVWLIGDATCSNATTATNTGATPREFVSWYGEEGSVATQCVEG